LNFWRSAWALKLVDVQLSGRTGEVFLSICIDKQGGLSLDDCEKFHKQALPLVEGVAYDYLECSSPGLDRLLKKQRDFQRFSGQPVQARLFAARDGKKELTGVLTDVTAQVSHIPALRARTPLPIRNVAQVRL
jgi:ribosome maturation factor RimP